METLALNGDGGARRVTQVQRNIISNFVQARNVDVIFGMLEDGLITDVNVQDSTDYDRTALMQQCYRGDFAAVQALLNLGADTNISAGERQGFKTSALASAVWKNNVDMVQLLLKHGADRTIRCGTYYGTVMDVAKSKGFDEIIEVLNNYYPPIAKPDIYKAWKQIIKARKTTMNPTISVPSKIVSINDFTASSSSSSGSSGGAAGHTSNNKREREPAARPYRLRPIHEPPDVTAARTKAMDDLKARLEAESFALIKSESEENSAKMQAFLEDSTDRRADIANRVVAYRMKTKDFKTPSEIIIKRYGW